MNFDLPPDSSPAELEAIVGPPSARIVQQASRPVDLRFLPLATADSDDAASRLRVSPGVLVRGQLQPIDYRPLARSGQSFPQLGEGGGEVRFGQLLDAGGVPMRRQDGQPLLCADQAGFDFTSLLRHGNDWFTLTQLECSPGGAYLARLRQRHDGGLRIDAARALDFAGVGGTYSNCAGSVTPWNSHLGSEEYEPSMALVTLARRNGETPDQAAIPHRQLRALAGYLGQPYEWNALSRIGYRHGWVPELAITSATGDVRIDKRYALGRFSHEQALVMPDRRSVYLSDDGAYSGFYLFVADRPDDLGSGTLYAARWRQTAGDGGGSATLGWVNLGAANQRQVADALAAGVTFDDLWELPQRQILPCPEGFRVTHSQQIGSLCLRPRPGAGVLASRLESRLYAAYHGATSEFNKLEGLALNATDRELYLAMSDLDRGMLRQSRSGLPDHIRLDRGNECGAVYQASLTSGVKDVAGAGIDSDYVARDIRALVLGRPDPQRKGQCRADAIANPDNLSFIPEAGTLLIAEDTRRHPNALVWAYRLAGRELAPIAAVPAGAEATALSWYQGINGFAYILLVAQHVPASGGQPGYSELGYIGPISGFASPEGR